MHTLLASRPRRRARASTRAVRRARSERAFRLIAETDARSVGDSQFSCSIISKVSARLSSFCSMLSKSGDDCLGFYS